MEGDAFSSPDRPEASPHPRRSQKLAAAQAGSHRLQHRKKESCLCWLCVATTGGCLERPSFCAATGGRSDFPFLASWEQPGWWGSEERHGVSEDGHGSGVQQGQTQHSAGVVHQHSLLAAARSLLRAAVAHAGTRALFGGRACSKLASVWGWGAGGEVLLEVMSQFCSYNCIAVASAGIIRGYAPSDL